MKRSDFNRFIDALEGRGPKKYRQAVRRLGRGRPEDCHMCAQGVLCDIMNNENWVTNGNGEIVGYNFGPHGTNNGGIPTPVLECIGATEPGKTSHSVMHSIPPWNDNGRSFKEIAANLKKAVQTGKLVLEDD